MFRNILVPTDFSKKSRQALEIASRIGVADKGKAHLLHVIEILADTTFEEFKDFYLNLEKRAEKNMQALAGPYRDGPVEIIQKILYGNRVEEILRYSRENEIDLIVMNSHRIDTEDPGQGWGTISYKVGVLSQIPVMLVK